MSRNDQQRQVEGGGLAGFGCAFVLAVAFAFGFLDLTNAHHVGWTLAIALVAAGIGARYGDRFFSWVLEKFPMVWWP